MGHERLSDATRDTVSHDERNAVTTATPPELMMTVAPLLETARSVLGIRTADLAVVVDPELEGSGCRGAAHRGRRISVAPSAVNDRFLLWHELVHIGQQQHVGKARPSADVEALEREANTLAAALTAGQTATIGLATSISPLYESARTESATEPEEANGDTDEQELLLSDAVRDAFERGADAIYEPKFGGAAVRLVHDAAWFTG